MDHATRYNFSLAGPSASNELEVSSAKSNRALL
jgi:hypothetical protein